MASLQEPGVAHHSWKRRIRAGSLLQICKREESMDTQAIDEHHSWERRIRAGAVLKVCGRKEGMATEAGARRGAKIRGTAADRKDQIGWPGEGHKLCGVERSLTFEAANTSGAESVKRQLRAMLNL
eukprot:1156470-Pelagomonas_calceolata.AAC.4